MGLEIHFHSSTGWVNYSRNSSGQLIRFHSNTVEFFRFHSRHRHHQFALHLKVFDQIFAWFVHKFLSTYWLSNLQKQRKLRRPKLLPRQKVSFSFDFYWTCCVEGWRRCEFTALFIEAFLFSRFDDQQSLESHQTYIVEPSSWRLFGFLRSHEFNELALKRLKLSSHFFDALITFFFSFLFEFINQIYQSHRGKLKPLSSSWNPN